MASNIKIESQQNPNTHGRGIPVEVTYPIEDMYVETSSTATFECRVEGFPHPVSVWYKDGKQLQLTHRQRISRHDKWHRLEINNVTFDDHGLYAVVISNNASRALSEANLYITPTRETYHHDGVLYVPSGSRSGRRVIKHLQNITVKKEQQISLSVQFENSIANCMWFKSNTPLNSNSHVIITKEERSRTCEMCIESARTTDSGVYMVATRTKHGYATSVANVHIVEDDPEMFTNHDTELPRIEEPMPEEQVVYEGEEARFTCRVLVDRYTEVKWLKNGEVINDSDERVIVDSCCNQCISMKILGTCLNDQAKYKMQLKCLRTGRSDSCSCVLLVKVPTKFKEMPRVRLRKNMDSAIACFGSQVSFECGFVLDSERLVFAVWYIGHYRIERTNAKFDVVCKNGEYVLTVKQVEPGMTGEVVCELRLALPLQPPVLLASSTATLTVVPLAILDDAIRDTPPLTVGSLLRELRHCPSPNIRKLRPGNEDSRCFHCPLVRRTNGRTTVTNPRDEFVLDIDYCRLEEPDYYMCQFLGKGYEPLVAVYSTPRDHLDTATGNSHCTSFVIQWEEEVSSRKCYAIELAQQDGSYIHAGLSTVAKFQLKNPPVDKWLRFRIRPALAAEDSAEMEICIEPELNTTPTPIKQHSLKTLDKFEDMFSKIKISDDDENIGRGAFGEVMLVEAKDARLFAAKSLKTRTQKHRDNAMREYDTMKQLQHPKLVQLHEAFMSKQMFVLVMDYLWGGELFDRIVEEDYIEETDVVPYVRQILEGLEYLHARNIVHMDLKPENIVCCSPNSRQVKIIDFGLARVLGKGRSGQRAMYGTKDYIAPEVINYEELTLACDMWSLGVVTYVLLSGVMPFEGEEWAERSVNITMANYDYCDSAFKEISDQAKDFIDGLLIKRPDKRMHAADALAHRWVREGPPRGARARHMKRTRDNLKTYLATYKVRLQWQKAANIMIAAQRLRNQAKKETEPTACSGPHM